MFPSILIQVESGSNEFYLINLAAVEKTRRKNIIELSTVLA